MAVNYPGPIQARIFYTTAVSGYGTIVHTLSLNFNVSGSLTPGTPFSSIAVLNSNGDPEYLDDVIDELILLLKPLFIAADVSFDYAECWQYEDGTFNADFISAYQISAVATGAGTTKLGAEVIATFRTSGGGTCRLTLEETLYSPGPSLVYNDLVTAAQDLVDWVSDRSPYNILYARDNTYPFAFMKWHPGQNEKLFKDRFR